MKNRKLTIAMSVVSIAGVILTGYLSAKCGIKAKEKLDAKREEKGEDLTTVEKAKTAGVVMAPAIVSGLVTAGTIGALVYKEEKDYSKLFGLYSLGEAKAMAYQKEMIKELGEEKEKEIRLKAATAKSEENLLQVNGEVMAKDENGEVLFYEPISGLYFSTTPDAVMAAEYHLNRNMVLRGYTNIRELLSFLDVKEPNNLPDVGWNNCCESFYGYSWVDFSHIKKRRKEDGREYIALAYDFPPHDDYMDCC